MREWETDFWREGEGEEEEKGEEEKGEGETEGGGRSFWAAR